LLASIWRDATGSGSTPRSGHSLSPRASTASAGGHYYNPPRHTGLRSDGAPYLWYPCLIVARRTGRLREEPTLVKTTLLLPPPLWRAAKVRALDERTNLKQIMVNALQAYLKTPKKEPR
jgi:hypothetical protein